MADLRVSVDTYRCQGIGLCEDRVPEVFEVKDGQAVVLQATVPAHLCDAVREAAKRCPTESLRLSDAPASDDNGKTNSGVNSELSSTRPQV